MNERRSVHELWGGLRISGRSGRPECLRLEGELELATCNALSALTRVGSRVHDVYIDASGLTFVDCAGLASLVRLAGRTRGAGGRFQITAASPALARAAELTGLTSVLAMPPSRGPA